MARLFHDNIYVLISSLLEICVSSDHAQVVVGSPFSISSNVVDEGSGDVFDIQGNCSFWTRVDATEGAGTEQVAAEDWAIVGKINI